MKHLLILSDDNFPQSLKITRCSWRNKPSWLKKNHLLLEKDLIGYGKIDGLISDPYIEDISCLGINKPVYIYHRKYANARTNIIFTDEEELDDFITRIVHRQGKHVSIAHPIVDLTLARKTPSRSVFWKRNHPCRNKFHHKKIQRRPLNHRRLNHERNHRRINCALTFGCSWKTKCQSWLLDPQEQAKQPH